MYKPWSSSAVILAMRLLIIGTGRKDKADITGTVINKRLVEKNFFSEINDNCETTYVFGTYCSGKLPSEILYLTWQGRHFGQATWTIVTDIRVVLSKARSILNLTSTRLLISAKNGCVIQKSVPGNYFDFGLNSYQKN